MDKNATWTVQMFWIMVLILDGNSEIGAHVRSNLCLCHFISHKSDFFLQTDLFSFMCA